MTTLGARAGVDGAPGTEDRTDLPGGLVVWIFVAVEILTFGAFLAAFAHAYAADEQVFRSSQSLLHPLRGTINTAVLLTGSWLVARSVVADSKHAARWLLAAGISGVVFAAIKISEYVDVFSAGLSMSTNSFWFYCLFLTFMHLLHVLFGIGVMFWLSLRAAARDASSFAELVPSIEAGAVYWHLVDLIWIMLFPTIYMMTVP